MREMPLWRRVYLRVMWPFWKLEGYIRYALTGKCGFACGYEEPYGFVPEAGCPIHDKE